mgnify:CR=1 FL=1
MKEQIFGQCPYCKGNLINGHRCPLLYNRERKTIEIKYIKSSCTKCGSSIDKVNPFWLREVRKKAKLGLRELGRKIGKSATHPSVKPWARFWMKSKKA